MAVKSQLGLKDLNVAAAASAHNKVTQAYQKNPKAQLNQVFTKLSPNERKSYSDVTSQVPTNALTSNVSMPQLRRQLQLLRQLKSTQKLNNEFEHEDSEQVVEAIRGFKDENNPPVVIVLQRKGIRIFPDGKKVAMYHNKQLGLVITIPYAGTGNSPGEIIPGTNIQTESVEQIDELKSSTLQSYLDKRPSPKIRDVARPETVGKPEERQKDIERANLTRIGRARAKAKLLKRNPPPPSRAVPEYDPSGRGYGQGRYMGDSVEFETGIMESLDQVAAYAQEEQPKAMAKHMKFADGSKLKVSHGAAKAIHMVHSALNDENKKKFADMLTHPKGFEKAAHFALSKVNFTINNK